MTPHLRSFTGGIIGSVLLVLCLQAPAQDPALRQFDPSDLYFQAWLKIREAEKAETDEQFLEAFEHYTKAASLFDTVGIYHPQWKPHLVKDRRETTRKSLEKIRPEALKEQQSREKKLDGFVLEGPGGEPSPVEKAELGLKPLTPEEEREVAALQRRIEELTAQLQAASNDRDANAAQLRRTLDELQARRDRMARAPLEDEVNELNAQIGRIERERDAMAAALRGSREEHQKAVAQLAVLQAERDAALTRAAELENNLQVQTETTNDVLRGLREQLNKMRALAAKKDRLLAEANRRNSELSQQLKESHAEIADLREERSELLKERDHMATLLKLNETERVKMLIEQNMQLGHDLNEARERLAEVAADNNRTAQDLVEAKGQLAVAKAKIIQLNTEHRDQAARLAELEIRLRNERDQLTASGSDADPRSREEIAILQGIIDRTLRVQEHRRKAQELLVETVKRKSIEDPEVWGAISMLNGQELQLTPEETKLVEKQSIDGEFVFAGHADPEVRRRAAGKLQESISIKSDLAKRAYSNKRFLVARECFESILDEHPGHVTTQLNLGVVHLRNDDPLLAVQAFNDALTIRPDLPYAHFMLGASHYKLTDYELARTHLLSSLEGDPDNAKAHVFLGSIAAVSGEVVEAEKEYQEATRLDPTLSEPFYNLAILRVREGKKKEALVLYRKALENGRKPDLDLEGQIGS